MKAALCLKYGKPEVIEIQEVKKPIPKDNEVLIRITAGTVQTGDCKMRNFIEVAKNSNYNPLLQFIMRLVMGYNRPKNPILGTELFGKIEAIGKKVTEHKIGDEVIVMPDMKMGAHAEYIAWQEGKLIVNKPQNITSEQAAALSFGGITALYFLRRANIQKGQTILIHGASGAVGSAAVQLAKYYGAIVTGVCGPDNINLVKSIGADMVIDYTKESLDRDNTQYDIIFDTVEKLPKNKCNHLLKKRGKYISVTKGIVMGNQKDLVFITELAHQNIYLPVIDKCFTLNEIVEAYKYVETGHKKGNVILIF